MTESSRSTSNLPIDSRLAVIEERFSTVFGGFQRIESALERLAEVSASLKEMLAVHDNQIKENVKNDVTIYEMIERRKEEYTRGVERVGQKMETMGEDLRRQIKSEISDYGDELKDAIIEFKNSQKEFVNVIDKKVDKVITEQEGTIDSIDARLTKLEKWRWVMLGGGTVVGFLLSKWDIVANLIGVK